jgi:hypothetical protein
MAAWMAKPSIPSGVSFGAISPLATARLRGGRDVGFLVLAVAGAVIAIFLLVAMPSPSIDAKRLISRLSGELV